MKLEITGCSLDDALEALELVDAKVIVLEKPETGDAATCRRRMFEFLRERHNITVSGTRVRSETGAGWEATRRARELRELGCELEVEKRQGEWWYRLLSWPADLDPTASPR